LHQRRPRGWTSLGTGDGVKGERGVRQRKRAAGTLLSEKTLRGEGNDEGKMKNRWEKVKEKTRKNGIKTGRNWGRGKEKGKEKHT